jgi:hypothetical protein
MRKRNTERNNTGAVEACFGKQHFKKYFSLSSSTVVVES